jgi:hypothetical protein
MSTARCPTSFTGVLVRDRRQVLHGEAPRKTLPEESKTWPRSVVKHKMIDSANHDQLIDLFNINSPARVIVCNQGRSCTSILIGPVHSPSCFRLGYDD